MRWCLLLAGCAASQPEMARRAGEGLRAHQEPVSASDLILGCDPQDALVWLDGIPRGTCLDYSGHPRGLKLGSGMHKVEVRKPGFWPYQTYLDASGTRAALTVKLLPKETSS